jgi:hypothetical protein
VIGPKRTSRRANGTHVTVSRCGSLASLRKTSISDSHPLGHYPESINRFQMEYLLTAHSKLSPRPAMCEAVKTVSAPLQNVVTVALNMRLLCTPLCSLLAVLNKLLVCLYYLARHISLLISLEIISLICYHLRPKETVLPDEMIVMAR